MQLWFARVLRDAFAAQAAGLFRPFKEIGAYHLDVLLRVAGKDSKLTGIQAIAEVIACWSAAPLFPDIPPALHALCKADIKVWKPFGSSYSYAVSQLGLSEHQVLMVASHPWDIVGAMQATGTAVAYVTCTANASARAAANVAGLRGVYVQRDPAEAWPGYLPAPDGVVKSFIELLELLGLPRE
eukprot:gene2860-3152_t